jgi:hypothetical protein
MKPTIAKVLMTVMLAMTGASPIRAQEMPAEYQNVLKTLGKQGDYKANVLRINIPRNDLTVTVDGVATPTPFGFGGMARYDKGRWRQGRRDGRSGPAGR